jgi:hypothetical protein
LGKIYGHFGVFETNGRKVLHFHSLLFGIFNPAFMSNILDDEMTSRLVKGILDSMVSCQVDLDYHTTALYRSKNKIVAPRFANVSFQANEDVKPFKVMKPFLKLSEGQYVPVYPGEDKKGIPIDINELKTVENNYLCGEKFVSSPDKKLNRLFWQESEKLTTNLDYCHEMGTVYHNLHNHCASCTKGSFDFFMIVQSFHKNFRNYLCR